MNNAEWMLKQGYKFSDLSTYLKYNNDGKLIWHIRLSKAGIDDILIQNDYIDAITAWLDAEHKEQILDDAEKRYLSAVIKPFRNKIKHIAKHGGNYHNYYYEYITVMYYVDQVLTTYSFGLPVFPEGTMYKGMEANKDYTLEDLGL